MSFIILFVIFIIIVITINRYSSYQAKINNDDEDTLLRNISKKLMLVNDNSHYSGIIDNNNFKLSRCSSSNKIDSILIKITPVFGKYNFELEKKSKFYKEFYFTDEFITGDKTFDSLININTTDKNRLFVLLNTKILELIKYFINMDSDFTIVNNSISFRLTDNREAFIRTNINNLIILSNCLTTDMSLEKLLMKNVMKDKDNEYRLKCMEMLVNLEDKQENNDFYISLLEDKNLEIVFLAINQLGETGIQKAIDLYKYADIDFSNKILTIFKKFSENNQIINTVIETLNLIDYKKSSLSIKFLNEINYNKFPDEIKSFLADEKLMENESELCKEIIIYCGRLKIEESVPFLIKELNSDNTDIVLSVLESFRLFDKIEFVEHILPLTKGFTPAEVKQKALKTIDDLQKNVSKDMKGTLSVAEISSEEGNLSIVDDEVDRGKLSLK